MCKLFKILVMLKKSIAKYIKLVIMAINCISLSEGVHYDKKCKCIGLGFLGKGFM